MTERYYSVEQVAQMLELHPKTVQRYIREERLKARKIGKSWRISGHDLSVFVEGEVKTVGEDGWGSVVNEPEPPAIQISAVVDVAVAGKNQAIRLVNSLTAAMNGKPPEYGPASLNAQIIEAEHKVRLMIWGGLAFTNSMLATISQLTGEEGSI